MILKNDARREYERYYGKDDLTYFFSHGRLELLGNHTDHNRGLCLVGGVDMGITAAVCKKEIDEIGIASKGFPPFQFSFDDLSIHEDEKGTSLALTRGVIAAMRRLGYKTGGFFAGMANDIFSGAGVSSSAAYEALIVEIESVLYNDGKVSPRDMAFISQYAEVTYFGKPCGMLDQVGASYGGVDYLDFAKPSDPIVAPLPWKFNLNVVLVNSGSSHAELTDLYASIPSDMKTVAKDLFGVEDLRCISKEEFSKGIVVPSVTVSERAKLRARHFFDENERVVEAKKAVEENNVSAFLDMVNASGESMRILLSNTMVPGMYEHSPQQAVDIAKRYIGHGAVRVMGGGFAGSIICFVLPSEYEDFMAGMISHYGKDSVVPVHMDEGGPRVIE